MADDTPDPRWKVRDAGDVPHPGAVTIEVDGIEVTDSVSAYTIDHDRHGKAQLRLHVDLVEVTCIGDAEPTWYGLDRLPASALRRALEEAELRESTDG